MNVDHYFPDRSRRRHGSLRLLLLTLGLAGACGLVAEPRALLRLGHALLNLAATLAASAF